MYAFHKECLFFYVPLKKRQKSATGGDKADGETPTSREEYIYTSATRHPRIGESTKIFSYILQDPGVTLLAPQARKRESDF